MKKILNYNFHDIVRMKVIINDYDRFFARTLEQKFAHYLVSDDIKEPDMTVQIGAFSPDLGGSRVLDDHYYINRGYVFCEQKYKIARWKVEIKGFGEEKTFVRIHGNRPSWWVFPGGTIYSILMLKLALKGYVMLHASGVTRKEKGYIFTGRSGTGKTITVFNLLKKGFDYLGDDTVILGKGRAYSFIKPLNVRFTYDVQRVLGVRFNGTERMLILFKSMLKMMSMGYINLFTKLDVRCLLPERLGTGASLDKLFFLMQEGDFSVRESREKEGLARQMLMDAKFESDELSAYILAYTYVFPESPLKDFWAGVENIIKDSIYDRSTYLVGMPKRYSLGDLDLLLKKIDE